jgi:general stress protein CsbA
MEKPVWLIAIGFVLEIAAIALVLLILLQVIPSTFLLNFFAFTISVMGLFMGFIGATSYVKLKREEMKKGEK